VVFAELIDQCPLIKDFLSPAKRVAEGIYAPVRIRKDWSYTMARFWKPGLVLVGTPRASLTRCSLRACI
jgi:halogenation protein CepH